MLNSVFAMNERRSWLRRLGDSAYRGFVTVHWTMTVLPRRSGWLDRESHAAIRECLFHALFLYRLACPLYCLMPDHLHILLTGWDTSSDQKRGVTVFRTAFNRVLTPYGFVFQKQPYDHVLRSGEGDENGLPDLASYIRANPHRAGIIADFENLPEYPFSGCLIPGFHGVSIWADDYWTRFWRMWGTLADHAERSCRRDP
jgi:hypothetical protein